MNEEDEKLLRQMIQESGEMWLGVRDRSGKSAPIIICRNPERAYYLSRAESHKRDLPSTEGWVIEERPLRMSDAAEFFSEFGSHWPYWHGATIQRWPFRAFIKNGRKERWSISLDMKTEPEEQGRTLESLQRQRSAELIAEFRKQRADP